MLSKIVNENEINILKNHIERKKPNIEIRLNILKNEEIKLGWLEEIKSGLSKRRYEICIWGNELCENYGYPIIIFIFLKNKGLFDLI